ncbi:Outer envelope membrane protein 7 [Nymphaea thermarum]|nr:Outer envelope membrane protein 7 [Nymphaea thermarum]
MAKDGLRERETSKNSFKAAGIVCAALAFGWMAVELAFKPFLDSGRKALDRANPDHDLDDDEDEDRQDRRAATPPSEGS